MTRQDPGSRRTMSGPRPPAGTVPAGRDPDELGDEVLELVTGGMGPQVAVENYSRLLATLNPVV